MTAPSFQSVWKSTLKHSFLWPSQCGNSQYAQFHWEIISDSRKICFLILVMGAYDMETNNIFKGDLFLNHINQLSQLHLCQHLTTEL